jgi:hypothetical protein
MGGTTYVHKTTVNVRNDTKYGEFLTQLKHLFRVAYRDLGVCQ